MTMSRKQRKANIFFYAAFNLAELIELAQRLRNVTCSCDSTQKPFSGSFNWAVVLTFVDGVEWLFRAPRTSYGLELDYYVAGLRLEEMIPSLVNDLETRCGEPGGFPLHHPDLSLNNIFIDDHCNITCIIDWAFSFFAPSTILLSTPGLPHPRDECKPSLTCAFRSGFINNGVTTCSDAWKKTRMAWLFMRLVSLDGLQDYHYFTELYLLINKQPAEELFTKFQQQYAKHEVMNMHWILSADDQSPSEIKQSEKVYFVNVGAERHALALKIRLVSMLNRSFVADRQLWHWIEEVEKTTESYQHTLE
ncbi:uncharacterized protein BDCG_07594 [Blastomyces dermatitidis ER-3]|uniref:Aminoglycoside phosphotransferase domain-containing protein n=1 Tax=Ajellomyces dermatitidis (strain ER-3 / ATCC MYA-2586) TaxID=559297 RepID=A0ABP2F5V9_AJEDR|nr:uncharacterized protein BDCG_07594 [Blastomyces dermatitidis ER-3]EEQ92474.2 hypothetical protein BDCG_07594 [Blastomyces dermatitidis ER-3]